MNTFDSKKALRSFMRKHRPTLKTGAAEHSIHRSVLTADFFIRAKRVHCYASYSSEVDTKPLLQAALEQKKELFMPCQLTDGGLMRHCQLTRLSDLIAGKWGIEEPAASGRILEHLDNFEPTDCIIVPLLAFDDNRHRLGYGKGFYDRFLASTRALTCGIAFDGQITESVFAEPHDVPLRIIITETKMYQ